MFSTFTFSLERAAVMEASMLGTFRWMMHSRVSPDQSCSG